jgi:acetyltransferase-like isoleucine patch superfamily enzyme
LITAADFTIIQSPEASFKKLGTEKGAWIGAAVIIPPSVIIGDVGVIACSPVGAKNIPHRSISTGIPAPMTEQIA